MPQNAAVCLKNQTEWRKRSYTRYSAHISIILHHTYTYFVGTQSPPEQMLNAKRSISAKCCNTWKSGQPLVLIR